MKLDAIKAIENEKYNKLRGFLDILNQKANVEDCQFLEELSEFRKENPEHQKTVIGAAKVTIKKYYAIEKSPVSFLNLFLKKILCFHLRRLVF